MKINKMSLNVSFYNTDIINPCYVLDLTDQIIQNWKFFFDFENIYVTMCLQNENNVEKSKFFEAIEKVNQSIPPNELEYNQGKMKLEHKNQTKSKRQRMEIHCPHKDKPHYAKGMCNNCYHSRGRSKLSWKCSHKTKAHYAKGLCQSCYQKRFQKE